MSSDDLTVVLVAAVAEDGTIGDDGALPWHYSADLRHFKETTMGSPVIMGRRTYESIVDRLGHALPGRTNIVLSTQPPDAVADGSHRPDDQTAIRVVADLQAALEAAARTADVAYVVGGRTVYEQTMPVARRLVITEIPGAYGGDTRFPPFEDRFSAVARTERGPLAFVTYERDD